MKRFSQLVLVIICVAPAALPVYSSFQRHREWSAPHHTAVGRVLSCNSVWHSEGGTAYTTVYSFKDEAGRDWTDSTTGIHYCLQPGVLLTVEWPEDHAENSIAREKK